MADIRKRKSANGIITYQVRYATKGAKSGYAYATFPTLKAAREFRENGAERKRARSPAEVRSVNLATDLWLKACELEGLNGREPVSRYTLQNYEYRASFITAYDWPKSIGELTAPDIVAFRSWLLKNCPSRELASRVLSSLHSIMKEMVVRGYLPHNPVAGIAIRSDARYREPVVIPSKRDVIELLRAADRLANSKNKQTARTWKRYRPMLYLAADTGMRPQEYLALSKASLRDNGVFVDRAIEGSGMEISVTKTAAGRRFIEVSPATLKMVRHYADHHAADNDHGLVFPTESGSWQSRSNWHRRGFSAACEEAGLVIQVEEDGEMVDKAKYSPYDLRHFFASMLIEKRVNLKKIQALMGHTSIETTLNVYGHLLEDAERQADVPVGLLGGLLAPSCGADVAAPT